MRRGAADAKKKTVWAFWHQPTNCRGSSGPGAPASFAAFALFPPGESPTATDRPTDRPTDRSTGGPRGAASERAARARGAAGIVFLRMCGRCQVPQPELQVAISYVVFRTALSAGAKTAPSPLVVLRSSLGNAGWWAPQAPAAGWLIPPFSASFPHHATAAHLTTVSATADLHLQWLARRSTRPRRSGEWTMTTRSCPSGL